jgi:hypothetical protein
MECWSVGVLEYWSIGVLEYWSIGVLGCSSRLIFRVLSFREPWKKPKIYPGNSTKKS